ncbi:hypothetical protein F7725_014059 [Dissostichus mawsoni]|uniref:Eukaryotic translation initiation factor 2-alpha kinase 1 n=1 Tax=Dissostichus mawsoni TaxID=36200 RepID=A0A7J5YX38_DISMA|nr:hypothetical protein F7725_014059 [Dissostichus mawsoni]
MFFFRYMNMDSRFAHLRQRDTSVSMLRVKMSRRRSQSQKENRERAVNTRRQLDQLPEMEMSSLDAMSVIQEKTLNGAKSAKSMALFTTRASTRWRREVETAARWKERKTLEKEKEMREKERKGVFKTACIIQRTVFPSLPCPHCIPECQSHSIHETAAAASAKASEDAESENGNKESSTCCGKIHQEPGRSRQTGTGCYQIKVCAVEPVVRAASTRSANRPPVTAPVVKDKPKGKPADARTTRSRAFVDHVAPPSDQEQNCKEPEEDMVVDPAPADSIPAEGPVDAPPSLSSFAPTDFIFKAPTGLPSFKFDPLTPRSADAFLTPSPSFVIPELFAFNVEPEAELSGPSPPKSPRRSPPHTSPTIAPPTPGSLLETKHDVSYFRSEMSKETDALSALCVVWEPKVEDQSIPEEMRDSIRTVVGQARLLMKQRFKQFGGLVDDCDLGRGEKITTCTDLQGFWDMVYYQKPSAAPAKPAGTKAAGAKSRLFAVKAAMKAKQQAAKAEKAAKDAGNDEENPSLDSQEPQPEAEPQPAAQVVFDGGFFQPQASPSSNYLTPRRFTRRSLALSQTPVSTAASPSNTLQTPALLRLTLRETPAQTPKSQRSTPQASRNRNENVSLCFSPAKEVRSDDTRPEKSPAHPAVSMQENTAAVPELSTPTPVRSLPTISVVMEQEEPSEAVDVDLPLSSRLSPSPCKTPLPVSHTPEPSPSLSFMLSPCPASHLPPPAVEASESEIPGLDFERYLQPSLRCSLSPQATVAVETLSSMAVDVEMESPGGPSEDLPSQREPASPGCLQCYFFSHHRRRQPSVTCSSSPPTWSGYDSPSVRVTSWSSPPSLIPSSKGLLRSEDCSGSSSHFWILQRHEVDSNVSLLNLASEEDDEVQFDIIGQRLAALNLLSPLAISDEFSTVRLQHNRAFTELLHAASSSLYPQANKVSGQTRTILLPKEGLFQAQTSRYLSEFEEMLRLGKGSYGNVFKVMNKLDGQYYAVKKILIKKVSKDDCMKVLREVKMLSSLLHVNVVGYHTAWMEHVQPAAYPASLLPALESPEQNDSSDQSSYSSSVSSSIIFQSRSQASTDSDAKEPPRETDPFTALVPTPETGQVVCPKTMRRVPNNYVPCVFLGQRAPPKSSKCPAMSSSALLEDGSSRSSIELNNNSCYDQEFQQWADLHPTKPPKEVQFHLMLYIQMQLCERSLKDWISRGTPSPKKNKPQDVLMDVLTQNTHSAC